MKKTKYTRKGIASLLAAVSIMGMPASLAAAQTTTPTTAPMMSVEIGTKGNVMLKGTVDSVGATSFAMKSWGGDWTVNVEPSVGDISKITVGDKISVSGMVNSGSAWTVDAKSFHDSTTVAQAVKPIGTHTGESDKPKIFGKVFTGTASNISDTSLTLTGSKGMTYTVNLDIGAKIINKSSTVLSGLSSIHSGDTLRVNGTMTGTSITAKVVRDVTI